MQARGPEEGESRVRRNGVVTRHFEPTASSKRADVLVVRPAPDGQVIAA